MTDRKGLAALRNPDLGNAPSSPSRHPPCSRTGRTLVSLSHFLQRSDHGL